MASEHMSASDSRSSAANVRVIASSFTSFHLLAFAETLSLNLKPRTVMAAADPVADKSGFLCTYMSTHPDTLVAYVKHFGKIDGNVSSAKMLSINSKVRNGSPRRIHGSGG